MHSPPFTASLCLYLSVHVYKLLHTNLFSTISDCFNTHELLSAYLTLCTVFTQAPMVCGSLFVNLLYPNASSYLPNRKCFQDSRETNWQGHPSIQEMSSLEQEALANVLLIPEDGEILSSHSCGFMAESICSSCPSFFGRRKRNTLFVRNILRAYIISFLYCCCQPMFATILVLVFSFV